MIYIGELWRYLSNQPPNPEDARNPLRVIAGNGLQKEVWSAVVSRFGIERVVEHYGLTEMPAGPYVNFYGREGACGFIPPKIRLQTKMIPSFVLMWTQMHLYVGKTDVASNVRLMENLEKPFSVF
eukprot:GABV01001890.1.p3 GENE.GABV01001890.1~~GABV01001890.1.p3  ORF type:complete len:125 (-),score=26.01 GABV01001890.1:413-787(-)